MIEYTYAGYPIYAYSSIFMKMVFIKPSGYQPGNSYNSQYKNKIGHMLKGVELLLMIP